MMQMDELGLLLKELRLLEFAEQYSSVAKRCEDEQLGHVDYLKALVEIEIESRYHKRIKSLLKKSKIPRAKDIKDFDVNRIPDLTQGTIKDLVKGIKPSRDDFDEGATTKETITSSVPKTGDSTAPQIN